MNPQSASVPLGKYRDYEGNLYKVVGRAKNAIMSTELVIYKKLLNGEAGRIWVIPLGKFMEKVMVNGKRVSRFARVQ